MSDADRGALLGEGLFETILVAAGVPVGLEEHLLRMARSASALGMRCPPDLEALVWPEFETSHEAEGAPARAALRVTLTAGSGRGLVPTNVSAAHVLVQVSALSDVPDKAPLAAVTVAAHRVDPAAAISGHKTVSWLPWVLARREALARGADVALVRTVEGDVCEADHANLFVSVDGVVVTPSLDRGVLPGITRRRVLDELRATNIAVEERALTQSDLESADEAWLTSSLDGVRALSAIDDRSLAAPGPVVLWLAGCINGY